MKALHDDDACAGFRIVQAGAHGLVPPDEGRFAEGVALALADGVRVIDDDAIAPLAGG